MAHLLIVDDDDAFRETLAETLESLGHAVAMASGGAVALLVEELLPGLPGDRVDPQAMDEDNGRRHGLDLAELRLGRRPGTSSVAQDENLGRVNGERVTRSWNSLFTGMALPSRGTTATREAR